MSAAPAVATPGIARVRRSVRLPSEAMLGVCLLVLGLTLAVLILTGAVKLG
jgi:hypothetical protein